MVRALIPPLTDKGVELRLAVNATPEIIIATPHTVIVSLVAHVMGRPSLCRLPSQPPPEREP